MTDQQATYAKVKPDIEAVSLPLFELSRKFLDKRGTFLPHAAVLTGGGTVELVAVGGKEDLTNSTEVLPILHDSLRQIARTKALNAIGVAEDVTITLPGRRPTRAIKVLFEHRDGIAVALYLPFEKFLFRFRYGDIFSIVAPREVNAWHTEQNA